MKKILKIVGNIITSLLIIILVLVLIIAIYSFIELDINEKEYCNIFGYSIFQIETGGVISHVNSACSATYSVHDSHVISA